MGLVDSKLRIIAKCWPTEAQATRVTNFIVLACLVNVKSALFTGSKDFTCDQ